MTEDMHEWWIRKKPEKAYESEKCEGEFKEHSSLVEGNR